MPDPPPVTFEQVLGSSLFAKQPAPGDAGWCGYLVRESDDPPSRPVTIDDGLNLYNGHFVFAPAGPAATSDDVQRFVTGVYRYLNQGFGGPTGKFRGTAFAWIPDATTPAFGPIGEYAFRYVAQVGGTVLGSDFNNHIGRRMTMSLPQGLSLSATATGLRLQGRGAVHVALVTSPADKAPAITPDAADLPCAGPYSGCLVFGGSIVPAATLTYFGTALRYVHPTPSGPVTQAYPVISTAGTAGLPYAAALDPLDPVNTGASADPANGRLRTLFAPLAAGNDPPLFDAMLRTATGLRTRLGPVGGAGPDGRPPAGAGAFVFSSAGAKGDAAADVYMTLAGDWAIAVEGVPTSGAGAGAANDLLCGVDGLERVTFRAYASDAAYDRLRYVTGCAAYAPRFPFSAASVADLAGAGDLLDDTYVTSWATVASGDGAAVPYLAQPASSPLYEVAAATESDGDGEPQLFEWYRTKTDLPAHPGFAVPLVPYAGVGTAQGFPPEELPTFETQVLAPTRKRAISPSALGRLRAARLARAHAAAGTPTATATTPQGFVVAMDGASYATVTLARSTGPDLAFLDVSPELQNLLQTNQLMGVIVDPRYVGAPGTGFAGEITMAGWTLAAAIGQGSTASDYRNVVILKFRDGRLRDLVATPEKWTDAPHFSLLASEPKTDDAIRLSGLSQWLQAYLDAAIAESDAGNPLYTDFARVVTDASWNGVLVLQADVASAPDQLEGLMAGIDASKLIAHHFGATVTPVTPGTNGPQIGRSSLFGLVDYQLPLYRQSVAAGGDPDVPLGLPVDGAYDFTVLQLQALFRNAAVVDFRSRIQLTLDELFGSRVTAAYGARGLQPATGVVLRGSYQLQGGKEAYVFEQDATTVFTLRDAVVAAVAFDRVQWDTLGETGSGDDAKTASRFLIWGQLDYAALTTHKGDELDVLSFGSPPGTPPEKLGTGLSFSNLKIDLTSPTATPNVITFAFDASGLAFDLATSTAREDSLFDSLELQLDSFLAAPAGKRPADYGYLPVASDLSLAAFDGAWYGVVYKLTLGGPGALVAKAGFESRLIVGWAPTAIPGAPPDSLALFTGISLPGAAPGAKLLSLQGVLKLSIDSIRLLRQPVAGHTGQQAFVLQLRNVGIRFLGIAKLPPGATINFFLFGALEGTGSLGWYAAYRKDAKEVAALDAPRPRQAIGP